GGDDTKIYGGLAVRGNLLPMLKTEIAGAYRTETRFDGDLKVRQWPITGSLYFAPVSQLYAGAGVGWYYTSFDYADELGLESETKQEFGVHVGGGAQVPLGPAAAIDLNGRYV